MKKVFLIATLSLVSVFGLSAATVNDGATPSKEYSSSVTANIAGLNEGFDFETKTLVAIFRLMPDKVKTLCVNSYKELAPRIENSTDKRFTYAGVTITPIKTAEGINLKFSYGNHSVVVENYTKAEFDRIFGL